MRLLVLTEEGYRCWICGLDDPPADTLDHVVARRNGGGHDRANLHAAHRRCNSGKGARQLLPHARVSERWG